MTFSFVAFLMFLALVGAEAFYSKRSGRAYPLNVAVSNLSCGVLSVCTNVIYAAAFVVLYMGIQESAGLIDGLQWRGWSFPLVFLLIDLCYYAYHRASHRVAVLWGASVRRDDVSETRDVKVVDWTKEAAGLKRSSGPPILVNKVLRTTCVSRLNIFRPRTSPLGSRVFRHGDERVNPFGDAHKPPPTEDQRAYEDNS